MTCMDVLVVSKPANRVDIAYLFVCVLFLISSLGGWGDRVCGMRWEVVSLNSVKSHSLRGVALNRQELKRTSLPDKGLNPETLGRE